MSFQEKFCCEKLKKIVKYIVTKKSKKDINNFRTKIFLEAEKNLEKNKNNPTHSLG